MKNSKEIAETVFKKRDIYREKQIARNRRIKRAASIGSALCVMCLVIVGAVQLRSVQHKLAAVNVPEQTTTESDSTAVSADNTQSATDTTETKSDLQATSEVSTAVTNTEAYPEHDSAVTQDRTEPDSTVRSTPETKKTQPYVHTDAPIIQDQTEPPYSEQGIIPQITDVPSSTEATSIEISVTEPTKDEMQEEPQWDEETIDSRFVEFTRDERIYRSKNHQLANSEIGNFLYDVVIDGQDYATETVYQANAKIYQIGGIAEECAVAVRFQGYNDYYVFTNRNYMPETLGDFMDAVNWLETVRLGSAYTPRDTELGAFDSALLMNILAEKREQPLLPEAVTLGKLFSVSISDNLLGIRNKSLWFTEDGYMTTNLMEWGYSFNIGAENTQALAAEVGVNSVVETTAPYSEITDDLIPE